MRSRAWLDQLDDRLRRQLEFLIEIDRLKSIARSSTIADGSRRENSAEHSWHLAMFATVLAEYAVGPIDVDRVVRMLLIHDVVEIDAGDVPIFGGAAPHDHAEREALAADRLFGMLPEDQAVAFRALWDEFEAAASDDARFAKALDRLQPSVLNHVVGGGTWTLYDVDAAAERAATRRIDDAAPALWTALEHALADAIECGWLRAPGAAADDR